MDKFNRYLQGTNPDLIKEVHKSIQKLNTSGVQAFPVITETEGT